MRKVLAVILILVLVMPLLFAALTLFAVNSWVLKRSFYRELLAEERLYAALLADARRHMDRPWETGDWVGPGALEGVPTETLAKALAQTVSAAYLRNQAVAAVDALFDALEGRVSATELALDLRPLKASLRGGSRQAFARALAEALPACRTGQDPLEPGSRLLACRPVGMPLERATQLIFAALPGALDRVPDRYPLTPEPHFLGWAGPVAGARLAWAAVILGLIAAAFWLGAAFLGGRNRADVTAFLGWSLLAPALLTLAVGLGVRFAFLGEWLLRAPPRQLWASRELAAALAEALRPVLQTVSRGFLITGAITLGLSLGLIAWWRSIRPED